MDHVLDPPALTRAKPTVADVVWLIAVVSVWLIAESGRSGGLSVIAGLRLALPNNKKKTN